MPDLSTTLVAVTALNEARRGKVLNHAAVISGHEANEYAFSDGWLVLLTISSLGLGNIPVSPGRSISQAVQALVFKLGRSLVRIPTSPPRDFGFEIGTILGMVVGIFQLWYAGLVCTST